MNFKKRILYYLSGFTIGLVIVFSMLGVRGCEWLPKTRITNAIESTQLYISKSDLENIKCNQATDQIFSLISNGEIDLSKSNTESKLKKYFIEDGRYSAVIEINFSDSISKIYQLSGLKKCTTLNSHLFVPLYMTNKMTLKLLTKLPNKKEELYNCALDYYRLDSNFSKSLLKEGKVIIDKSLPRKKPNPLYIIQLNFDSTTYYALIQQGEKRIRFKKLEANNNASEKYLNSFIFSSNQSIPCNKKD